MFAVSLFNSFSDKGIIISFLFLSDAIFFIAHQHVLALQVDSRLYVVSVNISLSLAWNDNKFMCSG